MLFGRIGHSYLGAEALRSPAYANGGNHGKYKIERHNPDKDEKQGASRILWQCRKRRMYQRAEHFDRGNPAKPAEKSGKQRCVSADIVFTFGIISPPVPGKLFKHKSADKLRRGAHHGGKEKEIEHILRAE